MNESAINEIYAGKSRMKAVQLFCHECMGYDGHRSQKPHISYAEAGHAVGSCRNEICPLWPYRTGAARTPKMK